MSSPYDRVESFIRKEMRMSHIYQPVMLRRLLIAGDATRTEIARDLLSHDPSQVEYYEQIVRDMVGRVLTAKQGLVERDGSTYRLAEASELSPAERQRLIQLCDEKVEEYLSARGRAVWEHRRRSGRPVPGTVRYEVLKRASYRCELCGISAEEKALEVDHIVPRNHGGLNDVSNLQALCYTCNASKRDRDDTDFRGAAEAYRQREPGCLFCELPADRVVAENELAVAIRDAFPVTDLHTLLIPKRHVADYFGLTQPEINAVHSLLKDQKQILERADASISGFNVGSNSGEAAGQTIFHCHVHLIPRRMRDTPSPRGGVRHVVAGRAAY